MKRQSRSAAGLSLVIALSAASVLVDPRPSAGVDHLVGGVVLRLRDPGAPKKRRLRLKTALAPAATLDPTDDPRQRGARLEIVGEQPEDGVAGPIVLPAALWRGLGRPRGSKGFSYRAPQAAGGVTRIRLRVRRDGVILSAKGSGRRWPYRITRPQGPVAVRFAIGDDLYCARFTDFARNVPGSVVAQPSGPPGSCGDAQAIRCGDGVADGTEECDDGNQRDDDGCSASCTLTSPDGACAGVTGQQSTALRAIRVASGIARPVHVTAPPLDPNRVFVVEQSGRIRIIENDVLLPDPFLSITDRVSCCSERGLLSLAFHPAFETNGWFFVDYTNTAGDTVIARYQVGVDAYRVDPSTERIVLTVHQPLETHNGGQLAFGPDGYLYASLGDGGGGGDPLETAQDDTMLLGKLLRLDADVEGPPHHAVPPTNPGAAAGSPLGLVWAKGLRNPWRFSIDRATGDLYIGDVGQGSWEEIDVQPGDSSGGENYGWDVFEGNGHCYEPPPGEPGCPPAASFTRPVLEYPNFHNPGTAGIGCSVTGGFVYRGCALPALRGTYFYGDYCAGFLRSFRLVDGAATALADHTAAIAPGDGLAIEHITSFGEDARGEIYIADYAFETGEIFKLVPAGSP